MTATVVDSEALSDFVWMYLLHTCILLRQDSVACIFFLDFAAHHGGYSVSLISLKVAIQFSLFHTPWPTFCSCCPPGQEQGARHKVERGVDLACSVLSVPAGQFGRSLG